MDGREVRLGGRQVERLALRVMQLVGWNYYQEHPPWTLEGLGQRLKVPGQVLAPTVDALERHGLLTRSAAEPPAYLPARPLEVTGVAEVIHAVRRGHEDMPADDEAVVEVAAVEDLVQGVEEAIARTLHGQTIKELALSPGEKSRS
jgi:membrane protein